jgi:iron complex outermembrane receptor protein
MQDLELGIKHQQKKLALSANIFMMNYKNQLILTGQINDVGAYTRTNVAKSYRAGLELDGGIQLLRKMRLNANVTFSQNKIKESKEFIDDYDNGGQLINTYKDADIAFSPNIISGAELNYELIKNLTLAFQSKYVGKQYLDNTSNENRKINAYFVSNCRLIYTIKPKFMREIDISFLANNIFNRLYESNGYTYSYLYGGQQTTENYYYPQAGFNFLAALTLKF